MGETFSTLLTEFYMRGPDYLEDDQAGQTRAKRWVNNAYLDVCERQQWPFLETTLTGITAPYAFADMRSVLSVVDITSGTVLRGENPQSLADWFIDVTLSGQPLYWYLQGDVLNVYPTNTSDLLTVHYVRTPVALDGPDDVPVIPDRFSDLIVDGALVAAHKDNDAYGKAQTLAQLYEQGITRMTESLLTRNLANHEAQIVRSYEDS